MRVRRSSRRERLAGRPARSHRDLLNHVRLCAVQPRPPITLRDLAGIDVPIVQTGMGWVAGPRLVSATAQAGALGILASATMDFEQLRIAIAEVKQRTTRPFGVNLRADSGDIDDRIALGLLDNHQADNERRYRAAQRDALIAYLRVKGYLNEDDSAAAVLRGWLTFLAGQPADFLLINLEDLWLEPAPQNVPGTWQERPNWQRKARYSTEEIRDLAVLNDLLKTISDIRAGIV